MKFPSEAYPAETFAVDGGKPDVGFVLPGRRSALGTFVSTHDVILREGLLGGVLNAGWPLLDPERRGARVDYDGLKKLDGRDRHRLRYRAKKGQDTLDVFLYLDARFRHAPPRGQSATDAEQGHPALDVSSRPRRSVAVKR
jgi:hypothetical protein